jgi:beta-N-acetylhexosaminidase
VTPASAADELRSMSLEEKIGQLFVLFAYGPSADRADFRNTELYGVATAAEVVRTFKPGGWIYFSARDNVEDPAQVATLSNDLQRAALETGAKVPLLIGIDQEQGLVVRIGPPVTMFAGNMAQGASRDLADARTVAAITGRELRAMGIHQDYAPDADVNTNPANPVIGVRSFSSDPGLAADLTAAMVRGFQEDASVIATAKHFPGHGDTKDDSHFALPVVSHTRDEWARLDAPPFRAAIAAGVDSIMTAHIVLKSLDPAGDPATLSRPIITGVLRGELGFSGLVVTDSMEMAGVREKYGDAEAAVRAIEAGVDQVLIPPAPSKAFAAVLAAVRAGRISEARIDESVARVLSLKASRGITSSPLVRVSAVKSVVGTSESRSAAQRVTDKTTTLVRNSAGLLPLPEGPRSVLVAGWGVAARKLGARLEARGASVRVRATDEDPSGGAIADIVDKASGRDLVVAVTTRAWSIRSQRSMVKALVETGRPVVTVAVRDPYDAAFYESETHLATYSHSDVAMESLARVLYGELAPQGKLPVAIPSAGGASYPLGHGLSW